jgi:hypothetical protein
MFLRDKQGRAILREEPVSIEDLPSIAKKLTLRLPEELRNKPLVVSSDSLLSQDWPSLREYVLSATMCSLKVYGSIRANKRLQPPVTEKSTLWWWAVPEGGEVRLYVACIIHDGVYWCRYFVSDIGSKASARGAQLTCGFLYSS